ncbi:MAG: CDP-alcohol phosphatidyltransferase family protein [Acidobacteriota bacterium]|nr:CDP-alcohol phosphatidyltransferase family protein [Acidobacteriota bacterium]
MNRVLTLPNMLSSLRMCLIPLVFYWILNSNSTNHPWLLAVFAFALGLDFLDGYLARRFSQESELGKILDPLADKLLTLFSIAALTIVSDFPLWVTIPVVTRDLIILLASSVMYRQKHLVKGSIALGKITFFLISLLIFVYIIDLNPAFNLGVIKRFFALTSLAFVVWSFDEYFLVYQRVKKNG